MRNWIQIGDCFSHSNAVASCHALEHAPHQPKRIGVFKDTAGLKKDELMYGELRSFYYDSHYSEVCVSALRQEQRRRARARP